MNCYLFSRGQSFADEVVLCEDCIKDAFGVLFPAEEAKESKPRAKKNGNSTNSK